MKGQSLYSRWVCWNIQSHDLVYFGFKPIGMNRSNIKNLSMKHLFLSAAFIAVFSAGVAQSQPNSSNSSPGKVKVDQAQKAAEKADHKRVKDEKQAHKQAKEQEKAQRQADKAERQRMKQDKQVKGK
jgi:hypothetical protein